MWAYSENYGICHETLSASPISESGCRCCCAPGRSAHRCLWESRMTEQDRVLAKCAWRLVPFMTLLYVVNYIDRVNVGFAALTMNKELGFSPSIYGFGAGVFFFSYALCQVPASMMIARIGPRRGIFWIVLIWRSRRPMPSCGAPQASTSYGF